VTATCVPDGWSIDYATARRLARTHDQERCEACGLWHIWTPLPTGSLVICWRCEERNVDPTTLHEVDGVADEPLCSGCVAVIAAEREARWAARDAVRWREAT
jgi:hypothetical protein